MITYSSMNTTQQTQYMPNINTKGRLMGRRTEQETLGEEFLVESFEDIGFLEVAEDAEGLLQLLFGIFLALHETHAQHEVFNPNSHRENRHSPLTGTTDTYAPHSNTRPQFQSSTNTRATIATIAIQGVRRTCINRGMRWNTQRTKTDTNSSVPSAQQNRASTHG